MARESSGHMSTQSVQPSMHFDSSMVTGTSARWGDKGMAVSAKVEPDGKRGREGGEKGKRRGRGEEEEERSQAERCSRPLMVMRSPRKRMNSRSTGRPS